MFLCVATFDYCMKRMHFERYKRLYHSTLESLQSNVLSSQLPSIFCFRYQEGQDFHISQDPCGKVVGLSSGIQTICSHFREDMGCLQTPTYGGNLVLGVSNEKYAI